jgi:hypothetical protein
MKAGLAHQLYGVAANIARGAVDERPDHTRCLVAL